MPRKELIFSVNDKLNDENVSPDNVSVHILEEYLREVAVFIRGNTRKDLTNVKARIIDGSFAVAVEDEVGALDEVVADFQSLKEGRLDSVDEKRINIFLEWQERAKKSETRAYSLTDPESDKTINIDSASNYIKPEMLWVDVEEYHYGTIFDMGGKSKSNVHLQLENGATLKVGTKVGLLLKDNKNRLYRKQLVRIKAKKNVETGYLKNEELISFEEYEPHYDGDELDQLIEEGTRVWGNINGALWVEKLRGNA